MGYGCLTICFIILIFATETSRGRFIPPTRGHQADPRDKLQIMISTRNTNTPASVVRDKRNIPHLAVMVPVPPETERPCSEDSNYHKASTAKKQLDINTTGTNFDQSGLEMATDGIQSGHNYPADINNYYNYDTSIDKTPNDCKEQTVGTLFNQVQGNRHNLLQQLLNAEVLDNILILRNPFRKGCNKRCVKHHTTTDQDFYEENNCENNKKDNCESVNCKVNCKSSKSCKTRTGQRCQNKTKGSTLQVNRNTIQYTDETTNEHNENIESQKDNNVLNSNDKHSALIDGDVTEHFVNKEKITQINDSNNNHTNLQKKSESLLGGTWDVPEMLNENDGELLTHENYSKYVDNITPLSETEKINDTKDVFETKHDLLEMTEIKKSIEKQDPVQNDFSYNGVFWTQAPEINWDNLVRVVNEQDQKSSSNQDENTFQSQSGDTDEDSSVGDPSVTSDSDEMKISTVKLYEILANNNRNKTKTSHYHEGTIGKESGMNDVNNSVQPESLTGTSQEESHDIPLESSIQHSEDDYVREPNTSDAEESDTPLGINRQSTEEVPSATGTRKTENDYTSTPTKESTLGPPETESILDSSQQVSHETVLITSKQLGEEEHKSESTETKNPDPVEPESPLGINQQSVKDISSKTGIEINEGNYYNEPTEASTPDSLSKHLSKEDYRGKPKTPVSKEPESPLSTNQQSIKEVPLTTGVRTIENDYSSESAIESTPDSLETELILGSSKQISQDTPLDTSKQLSEEDYISETKTRNLVEPETPHGINQQSVKSIPSKTDVEINEGDYYNTPTNQPISQETPLDTIKQLSEEDYESEPKTSDTKEAEIPLAINHQSTEEVSSTIDTQIIENDYTSTPTKPSESLESESIHGPSQQDSHETVLITSKQLSEEEHKSESTETKNPDPVEPESPLGINQQSVKDISSKSGIEINEGDYYNEPTEASTPDSLQSESLLGSNQHTNQNSLLKSREQSEGQYGSDPTAAFTLDTVEPWEPLHTSQVRTLNLSKLTTEDAHSNKSIDIFSLVTVEPKSLFGSNEQSIQETLLKNGKHANNGEYSSESTQASIVESADPESTGDSPKPESIQPSTASTTELESLQETSGDAQESNSMKESTADSPEPDPIQKSMTDSPEQETMQPSTADIAELETLQASTTDKKEPESIQLSTADFPEGDTILASTAEKKGPESIQASTAGTIDQEILQISTDDKQEPESMQTFPAGSQEQESIHASTADSQGKGTTQESTLDKQETESTQLSAADSPEQENIQASSADKEELESTHVSTESREIETIQESTSDSPQGTMQASIDHKPEQETHQLSTDDFSGETTLASTAEKKEPESMQASTADSPHQEAMQESTTNKKEPEFMQASIADKEEPESTQLSTGDSTEDQTMQASTASSPQQETIQTSTADKQEPESNQLSTADSAQWKTLQTATGDSQKSNSMPAYTTTLPEPLSMQASTADKSEPEFTQSFTTDFPKGETMLASTADKEEPESLQASTAGSTQEGLKTVAGDSPEAKSMQTSTSATQEPESSQLSTADLAESETFKTVTGDSQKSNSMPASTTTLPEPLNMQAFTADSTQEPESMQAPIADKTEPESIQLSSADSAKQEMLQTITSDSQESNPIQGSTTDSNEPDPTQASTADKKEPGSNHLTTPEFPEGETVLASTSDKKEPKFMQAANAALPEPHNIQASTADSQEPESMQVLINDSQELEPLDEVKQQTGHEIPLTTGDETKDNDYGSDPTKAFAPDFIAPISSLGTNEQSSDENLLPSIKVNSDEDHSSEYGQASIHDSTETESLTGNNQETSQEIPLISSKQTAERNGNYSEPTKTNTPAPGETDALAEAHNIKYDGSQDKSILIGNHDNVSESTNAYIPDSEEQNMLASTHDTTSQETVLSENTNISSTEVLEDFNTLTMNDTSSDTPGQKLKDILSSTHNNDIYNADSSPEHDSSSESTKTVFTIGNASIPSQLEANMLKNTHTDETDNEYAANTEIMSPATLHNMGKNNNKNEDTDTILATNKDMKQSNSEGPQETHNAEGTVSSTHLQSQYKGYEDLYNTSNIDNTTKAGIIASSKHNKTIDEELLEVTNKTKDTNPNTETQFTLPYEESQLTLPYDTQNYSVFSTPNTDTENTNGSQILAWLKNMGLFEKGLEYFLGQHKENSPKLQNQEEMLSPKTYDFSPKTLKTDTNKYGHFIGNVCVPKNQQNISLIELLTGHFKLEKNNTNIIIKQKKQTNNCLNESVQHKVFIKNHENENDVNSSSPLVSFTKTPVNDMYKMLNESYAENENSKNQLLTNFTANNQLKEMFSDINTSQTIGPYSGENNSDRARNENVKINHKRQTTISNQHIGILNKRTRKDTANNEPNMKRESLDTILYALSHYYTAHNNTFQSAHLPDSEKLLSTKNSLPSGQTINNESLSQTEFPNPMQLYHQNENNDLNDQVPHYGNNKSVSLKNKYTKNDNVHYPQEFTNFNDYNSLFENEIPVPSSMQEEHRITKNCSLKTNTLKTLSRKSSGGSDSDAIEKDEIVLPKNSLQIDKKLFEKFKSIYNKNTGMYKKNMQDGTEKFSYGENAANADGDMLGRQGKLMTGTPHTVPEEYEQCIGSRMDTIISILKSIRDFMVQ